MDIGGQIGDPIGAFAAGTVEYVGRRTTPTGCIFQIDHGNGVKSFYAHCSKLCVSKGQTVAAGEKVAEVGSSGAATGPHLHLELKCNGLHVNPTYYIEFLTDRVRLGRWRSPAAFFLLLAWLNYTWTQGLVPLAVVACALHELGHYAAIRAVGGEVKRIRLTAVGAEMELARSLGYWQGGRPPWRGRG
ncbi:MAG: M23 family metallopeptidase [Lawsonibacter sp.]